MLRAIVVSCSVLVIPAAAAEDERLFAVRTLKRQPLVMPAVAKAKPPSAVKVDCARGEKIQDAIDRHDSPMTIDVRGICAEDVVVDGKNVALRGDDPAADGIRGVASNSAALRFRHSSTSSIENLGISHGAGSGVNVSFSAVFIRACQMIGNAASGLAVDAGSRVQAVESVLSENVRGVSVGGGATFFCTGCRLENNSRFAGIASGGVFSLLDSVVVGRNGIVAVGGGAYADIDCLSADTAHPCSMNVTATAASAFERGTAAIWGVPDFTGQVSATDGAMVSLYGSTQLAAGQPGEGPQRNSVTRFGRLVVDPSYDFGLQNSRVLGTDVTHFGGLIVSDVAALAGAVQCESGGDAWLDSTITVEPGAAASGCEHAVLPPAP
jgi:hypothetical protein